MMKRLRRLNGKLLDTELLPMFLHFLMTFEIIESGHNLYGVTVLAFC